MTKNRGGELSQEHYRSRMRKHRPQRTGLITAIKYGDLEFKIHEEAEKHTSVGKEGGCAVRRDIQVIRQGKARVVFTCSHYSSNVAGGRVDSQDAQIRVGH